MSHTTANPACVPSSEARSLSVHPEAHVASAEELALLSLSARLLFENGQSTEKVVSALDQLAAAMGFRATVFPRWGELTVLITDGSGSRNEILASVPAGVDMRKVAATIGVIDDVCAGRLDGAAARSALETIVRFPPVSITRFAPCGGRSGGAWRDFRRDAPVQPAVDRNQCWRRRPAPPLVGDHQPQSVRSTALRSIACRCHWRHRRPSPTQLSPAPRCSLSMHDPGARPTERRPCWSSWRWPSA
jgi:Putative threonine/serine exporter